MLLIVPAELLTALEEELLDPAVIERTIEKAVAELARDETGSSATAQCAPRRSVRYGAVYATSWRRWRRSPAG